MDSVSNKSTSHTIPSNHTTTSTKTKETRDDKVSTSKAAAVAEGTLATAQGAQYSVTSPMSLKAMPPQSGGISKEEQVRIARGLMALASKESAREVATVSDPQEDTQEPTNVLKPMNTGIIIGPTGQSSKHKIKDQLIRQSGIFQLLQIPTDMEPLNFAQLPTSLDAANEKFGELTLPTLTQVQRAFKVVQNAKREGEDPTEVGYKIHDLLMVIRTLQFHEVVLAAKWIRHLAEPTYNESLSHVRKVIDEARSIAVDLNLIAAPYRGMYEQSKLSELSKILSAVDNINKILF